MADGFLYYQEVMTRLVVAVNRLDIAPLWENGTSGRLPPLDPTIQLDNHTGASGVNRAGTAVGYSQTPSGWTPAVMWRRQ